jgi:tetraacyldisaccharide 4'-kinase
MLLLYPLSELWSFIYRLRRAFYTYDLLKRNILKAPVISIGNISFGGTGKTPFTIWLTSYLEEKGKDVCVLTRGYKSSLEQTGGFLESKEDIDPIKFGDEPSMIAFNMQRPSIIVGKNRSQNFKKYTANKDFDFVILDDGFQHLKILRSLDILMFDANMSLDQYFTCPKGYLRESFETIKCADVYIINKVNEHNNENSVLLEKKIRETKSNALILKTNYVPVGLFNLNKKIETTDIESKKIVAISAIASPESFYQTLYSLNINIDEKSEYSDHFNFDDKFIDKLLKDYPLDQYHFICTEKDYVKLSKFKQLENSLFYLRIKLEFLSGQGQFLELINTRFSLE